MQVVIKPSVLGGKLSLPTSKSMGHRIMICRYLASGEISTEGLTPSKDIYATARALEGLSSGVCNCGESGSTLRFLMPIALARGGKYTFTGEGRLMQRPMDTYKDIFTRMGISWNSRGDKITVDGKLKSGHYTLVDPLSSQYVTGLLLALPLLDGDSVITLSQKLESSSYVDITQSVQNKFGVFSLKTLSGYEVRGNQQYKNSYAVAEPDASQAAVWLVANKLGSNI